MCRALGYCWFCLFFVCLFVYFEISSPAVHLCRALVGFACFLFACFFIYFEISPPAVHLRRALVGFASFLFACFLFILRSHHLPYISTEFMALVCYIIFVCYFWDLLTFRTSQRSSWLLLVLFVWLFCLFDCSYVDLLTCPTFPQSSWLLLFFLFFVCLFVYFETSSPAVHLRRVLRSKHVRLIRAGETTSHHLEHHHNLGCTPQKIVVFRNTS